MILLVIQEPRVEPKLKKVLTQKRKLGVSHIRLAFLSDETLLGAFHIQTLKHWEKHFLGQLLWSFSDLDRHIS